MLPFDSQIKNYIESPSRNKLIFFKCELHEINPIDIGEQLSTAILMYGNKAGLSIAVFKILEEIFQKNITHHPIYGNVLAIKNIGILFEPELKINVLWIFDNYSQNNTLFIQWEGEIENQTIWFLTKEKGVKLNLSHISHLILHNA